MTELKDMAEYIAERNQALLTMDMAWAEKRLVGADPETVIISMHKTRVEVTSIPEPLRRESMQWLKAKGYGRIAGLPWPSNDELPEGS